MFDICTEPDILKVLLFIKKLLDIVLFIVPIGLIVIISIDFSKSVIAGKVDEMQKNLNIVIKRIMYCVVLFLLPTIISFALSLVDSSISSFDVTYESCITNIEHIDYYEKLKEAREKEQEQKQENEQNSESVKNNVESMINSSNSNSGASSNGELTLDWKDVTKISNVSVSDLKKMLSTTDNRSRFAPYAATYVDLERKYGVNVYLLLAMNIWESNWLRSKTAKNCNNLGGVKFANQRNATKCTVISTESNYYAKWSSVDEFLNYYVPWLKETYLTEGGSFYNGKTPEGIVINYNVGSTSWVKGIKDVGNSLYEATKEVMKD